MAEIKTYPLQNSTVLRVNSEREFINVAPSYQRKGDVWPLEKKQLLIDSVLNDYDIPKLYFHSLSLPQKKKEGGRYDYAIIDGRQRIETLWNFLDNSFSLAKDFFYLGDKNVKAGGLSYSELAEKYPRLKIRFDSYTLPIICVETEDTELIEDMFSRLNEAVPLNAAEKRGAIGGPLAKNINTLSGHTFFKERVKFSDGRYRYREIAARLLFLEYSKLVYKRIVDTKKPYLDDMVRKAKEGKFQESVQITSLVNETLNTMNAVFEAHDPLLRAQAAIPVYYLVAQTAIRKNKLSRLKRKKIEDFFEELRVNRAIAEEDLSEANFEYLEFDRMSQQGTNDAPSIRERARILEEYLGLR